MKKIFLLSLVLLFWVAPVFALEFSPTLEEVELDPGENAEGMIKMLNSSEKKREYSVNVMPFSAKEDGRTPDFVNVDLSPEQKEFLSWIEPESEKLVLESGQVKLFNYKINIPPNAPPWRLLFWNIVQRVRSKDCWPK